MGTAEKLASIDPGTARRLLEDGYFDAAFYRRAAHLPSEADAFEHFFNQGQTAGVEPNNVFDTRWYLEQNPDVARDGFNPLLHYALIGEGSGRNPSPLFDAGWYAETHKTPRPLPHYLAHRFGPYSPIPEFDAEYYLKAYPDVPTARMDPFLHYMHFGFREFRKPAADFNPRLYANRFLKEDRSANPLIDLRRRKRESRLSVPPAATPTSFELVRDNARAGHLFETRAPTPAEAPSDALVLAYYLTQFHQIAENDAWWGEGFTEWTHLSRGQPRFCGHYQPRTPGALGFYDLADVNVMRTQALHAKSAGLHGFVFYYYDFDGRRLLEKPLEQFLAAPDIDIGFCLMWANENWTRRWDGAESEVLISQTYDERDERRRCAEFVRHFRDPRYVRLEGRPLLMIYRAGVIPQCARTIARWRRIFAEHFGESPIFVMAQTFEDVDPQILGLDGAVEFPPHKLTRGLPQIYNHLDIFDPSFEADVFAYDDLVEASLSETPPAYPLIKTAVPHWDNDARRQGKGLSLVGSTPLKYERWLASLVARARERPTFGRPLVCINAWNEWSEGAYLEPDTHLGWAYLNATSRAICNVTRRKALIAAVGRQDDRRLSDLAHRLAAAFGFEVVWNAKATGALAALVGAGASASIGDFARAGLRTVAFFDESEANGETDGWKAAAVILFVDEPTRQRAIAEGRVSETASFVLEPSSDDEGAESAARSVRDWLAPATPKISVCCVHRSGSRPPRPALESLFAQTHPVWEIFIFDDGSSPASFDEIDACAHDADRDATVVIEERIAEGSLLLWRRAVEMTTGDLLWMTNMDAITDPIFLERVAAPMRADPGILATICDGGESGQSLSRDRSPLSDRKPPLSFVDTQFEGGDFARRLLADKDLLARAECVLWRREALAAALAELEEEREFELRSLLAAIALSPRAKIAYVADTLVFAGYGAKETQPL